MFKPIVHEITVEDAGESVTLYVREPSGREILVAAAGQKKDKQGNIINDKPAIDNAKELFAKYVVNKDGSAITDTVVDEILDMRLSAMQKVSDAVMEKIGLKKAAEKNA